MINEDHVDVQYLSLLKKIISNGIQKEDRTGTGTRSIFGHQMRFHLPDGFPLLTTKKIHMKSVIYELLWFLRGDTNVKYLNDHGVTIWSAWADDKGHLGPVYGAQWRSWEAIDAKNSSAYETEVKEIDQIAQVIETLKTNPDDRRMIVSAWNVGEIELMALPPCHLLFQFYTHKLSEEKKDYYQTNFERGLSCQIYQRSCDTFLGVPFNIASYALLTQMVAHVVGMLPFDLIWVGGDVHVYNNHINQCIEQMLREPKDMPTMKIANRGQGIDDFQYEDFTLEGYDPHPAIRAPISV